MSPTPKRPRAKRRTDAPVRAPSRRASRKPGEAAGLVRAPTGPAKAEPRKPVPGVRAPRRAAAVPSGARALYRTLFDHAADGIFVSAAGSHRFIDANPRGCEMLGCSREELLRLSILEFIPPEDLVAEPIDLSPLQAGGAASWQRRLRRRDGTTFDAEIGSRFLPDGCAISILRDVSANRRADQVLRESEARYRALFEHATDCIVLADGDLRILDANPRACELLGYTRAELVRMSARDLPVPENVAAHPFEIERWNQTQSGTSRRPLRRKDGSIFIAETHASRLPDDGVIAVFHDVTERERESQALRESEAKYRAAIEQASEGITLTDPQWRFLDANPRACEMFGYSREELLRMSVRDIGVPEDLSTHALHDGELRRGEMILTERPMRRKDGTIFMAEVSARGLPNGSVVSVVRDITQRRRADQALRVSEERFRSVFESDMMGMVFGLRGGEVTSANDYVLRLLGVTRDDLLAGRVRWNVIGPPELADLVEQAARESDEAGTSRPFETEIIRTDGTRVPVLCGAAFIGPSRDFGVGFVLDLTELKRTERRLAESERYLDRAQELAHVGTWDADLETMTAIYSGEMLRIHGMSPDANPVPFAGFLASIHPDDRPAVEQTIRQAMESPGKRNFEHRVLRRDGTVRVVAATSETVLDASGRPVRIIGSIQDITERRLLELQLREAQRLESIGRLAGGVAHDFNNLLTVILGFTETLLEGLPAGDERRAGAEQILAAGRRAADLTQQLLAFGRRQVLRMQVFDLGAVLTEMQGILQRSVGEQIEVAIPAHAGPCLVKADRGQIEQVILNLALNARDAMPAGGRVAFVIGEAASVAGAPARPDGRWLQIAVTDTGTGMDPEVQAHIFEPFFTTKEVGRGTGLGLATVYGIVTQMGGRIEVESAPGEGTTFRVFLPYAREEAGPRETALAALASEPRGEETVLLVEDESAVRGFIAGALRRQGYHVIEPADGDQAIDTAHGQAGAIHLLVTDLVMPGMTGRELARFLTHERPGLRVLFISGYSDERAEPRGSEGGSEAGAFLQKPFTPVVLARRVRQVLDARAQAKPSESALRIRLRRAGPGA